jgi:hypothetical protein
MIATSDRKASLPVLLLLSCFIFSAGSLEAQGLGQIGGAITDPTGAAVAGAKITVTEVGTGTVRTAETAADGFYAIASLRPSTYDLAVEKSGFRPVSSKGLVLQADQSITVNLPLAIGAVSESIEVNAAVAQVDTSTSTISEVVDQRRIVELPLNGRNAASLALITAGTVLGPPTGADEGNTKTFPVSQSISANGARQNQTSYRLDGANNNDIYTNTNQPFPFPDALQEFSVQTSNYSARYGGNAGGVVNIVTKSGTNEFHGDLFEFNRNSVFNAHNFFSASRDQYKRNQFGGVVGGPVDIPGVYHGKNKTFFFVGYQGTRIRNTNNSTSSIVPTAAALNGNFSSYLTKSLTGIKNPLTGQNFPNAQIPVTMFDPAAVKLTSYLPVAASGNGQIFYASPIAQSFDETIVRVDHNLSEKDHLTGRYFYDRYNNDPYLDLHNYLSNAPYAVITSNNFMLNETHTFGPGLVNDFRFSVAREVASRGPASGSINAGDLGVNIYQPPGAKILESISVTNFFSVSQTDPASFTRDQYNLSDAVSLSKGSHVMSFGVDAYRSWIIIRNQFHQPGNWSFSGDYTGLGLADFLLGDLRTFNQGNGEFKDNRMNGFGLFFTDDWRVNRRLTINLGLRFDPFFPWKETKGRVEVFNPAAYNAGQVSTVFPGAPPGLLFPGDSGVPQYGLRSNFKNFGLRVGFAYDLTGDGKTSLRAGFGMFYDSLQNGIYNNRFVDVSPFSLQVNYSPNPRPLGNPNPITFSNPYPAGFANPFPAPYPPPKNIVFPLPALVASYDVSNGGRYQTPVSYAWNLTLERQLRADWLVRFAYVGSHASHLLETLELSPIVQGTKNHLYPQYSDIAEAAQDINSSYNSLQLTAQKRFSKGLTLQVNYTYSKSMDDLPFGQSITTVVNSQYSPIPWNYPGRHQFDTGPSEFDHQHRFVGTFVWDMPRLLNAPAVVRYLVGGWELSGLLSAQTGGPVTAIAGKDQSGTGLGTDRASFVSGVDPYGTSNSCAGVQAICVAYLNPAAFALPASGTFGNVGKGALRGPGMFTYDGGLFKTIPLRGERLKLQFRAEFFNLFNRANFYNPGVGIDNSRSAQANSSNGAPSNPTQVGFGSIKAAFDPRIGQLALKMVF